MARSRTQLAFDVVGFGALAVYLAAAFNVLPIVVSERLMLALVFAIGPVAIVGVLGFYERLRHSPSFFLLRVGTVFLVVAFALLNLMLVVQQMVRLQFRQFRLDADAARAATLETVFRGTNLVQLGIDVSFDVFYCLGVIALSLVMYRDRDFGRLLGGFGVVSAGLLLAFNLATFPYGPADSGLVDLGPLTALWWIAAIVQVKRAAAREARVQGAAAGADEGVRPCVSPAAADASDEANRRAEGPDVGGPGGSA